MHRRPIGPLATLAVAGVTTLSACRPAFPGLDDIREQELRSDLFTLAGDGMRGREAATPDELRASMWLAQRARAAGLEPAGEDGTWFQWFGLRRSRVGETTRIAVGSTPLELWRDAVVMSPTDASAAGPVMWLGAAAAEDSARYDVEGRIVAVEAVSGEPPSQALLASRYFVTRGVRRAASPWLRRGAAAVLVVADPALDDFVPRAAAYARRGRVRLDEGEPSEPSTQAPTVLVPRTVGPSLREPGVRVEIDVRTDDFTVPSVNVIGRVPGADPVLRGQVVLFSSHQDHDGVRATVDGDSIYNGADDNGTTSVALLAIARAFARHPGRRSALFVWHGAEEKGLYGSQWHSRHPVVPLDSVVAVLNGDMIGRNAPDTAALLGAIPPHRNSTPLVDMALAANREVTGLVVDSTWDRLEHPEGWYFRSDHLPYARLRVPAVFFTTLLHDDYHTQFDDPDRIDYAKLTRMTRWMYATGWLVANADERPTIDEGFELERRGR
ncbi:MAG TPA: M28 family peptidase [Longimicrobiales bacterium]|nr:M28 family peptidase [Longimicrobiales bacterium]